MLTVLERRLAGRGREHRWQDGREVLGVSLMGVFSVQQEDTRSALKGRTGVCLKDPPA